MPLRTQNATCGFMHISARTYLRFPPWAESPNNKGCLGGVGDGVLQASSQGGKCETCDSGSISLPTPATIYRDASLANTNPYGSITRSDDQSLGSVGNTSRLYSGERGSKMPPPPPTGEGCSPKAENVTLFGFALLFEKVQRCLTFKTLQTRRPGDGLYGCNTTKWEGRARGSDTP